MAALSGPALAAPPKPVIVNGAFADPVLKAGQPAPPPATCPLAIVAVVDGRRAPDTLGVVGNAAVKSPADIAGWLRSIAAGLGSRGFDVDFVSAPPTGKVSVSFALTKAWLNYSSTNKMANFVIHISASNQAGEALDQDFRGDIAGVNWMGTKTEMQGLIDYALAKALDQMTPALAGLCPGPPPA